MEWMDISGYTILRFWGISAAMLLFYYLLFDRKALYPHCRAYLLCTVFCAAIVSVARIPVYMPDSETVVNVAESSDIPAVVAYHSEQETVRELPGAAENNIIANRAEESRVEILDKTKAADWTLIADKIRMYWEMVNPVGLVYWGVVILLLSRFLLGVIRIWCLKRSGSCEYRGNICVVRSNRVTSPFSFIRTIFINRKLTGESLRVILAHEESHIYYRHYMDTIVMEIVSALCWFNPIVWLVKKELRALHEFQVDRRVLAEGLELHTYQNIIFEELMGYSPDIANGFHNSLIKKRFLMMKNGNCIRHDLLRKLLVVPFCGAVFALFAFAEKDQSGHGTGFSARENQGVFSADRQKKKNAAGRENLVVGQPAKQQTNDPDSVFKGMTENQKQIYKQYYSPNIRRPAEKLQHQILREDQIVVFNDDLTACGGFIRCIETDENETRVTIVQPVTWDRQWVQYDKGECLVDAKSGKVYRCKGVARGIDMNKAVWIHEKRGKMVEFTVIFEPLAPSAEYINFEDRFPEENGPVPPNAVESRNWKNIDVASYAPRKGEVIYNYLLNEQIPAIRLDEGVRKAKLLSFLREGDETKVTFAVPMNFNKEWISFSSGWTIQNSLTKEKYPVRRVERNIPLDRVNMIRNRGGEFITFTMVFPYVPMDVKFVDITELQGKKEVALPQEGKPILGWYDIFVENNRFPYNTPATLAEPRL